MTRKSLPNMNSRSILQNSSSKESNSKKSTQDPSHLYPNRPSFQNSKPRKSLQPFHQNQNTSKNEEMNETTKQFCDAMEKINEKIIHGLFLPSQQKRQFELNYTFLLDIGKRAIRQSQHQNEINLVMAKSFFQKYDDFKRDIISYSKTSSFDRIHNFFANQIAQIKSVIRLVNNTSRRISFTKLISELDDALNTYKSESNKTNEIESAISKLNEELVSSFPEESAPLINAQEQLRLIQECISNYVQKEPNLKQAISTIETTENEIFTIFNISTEERAKYSPSGRQVSQIKKAVSKSQYQFKRIAPKRPKSKTPPSSVSSPRRISAPPVSNRKISPASTVEKTMVRTNNNNNKKTSSQLSARRKSYAPQSDRIAPIPNKPNLNYNDNTKLKEKPKPKRNSSLNSEKAIKNKPRNSSTQKTILNSNDNNIDYNQPISNKKSPLNKLNISSDSLEQHPSQPIMKSQNQIKNQKQNSSVEERSDNEEGSGNEEVRLTRNSNISPNNKNQFDQQSYNSKSENNEENQQQHFEKPLSNSDTEDNINERNQQQQQQKYQFEQLNPKSDEDDENNKKEQTELQNNKKDFTQPANKQPQQKQNTKSTLEEEENEYIFDFNYDYSPGSVNNQNQRRIKKNNNRIISSVNDSDDFNKKEAIMNRSFLDENEDDKENAQNNSPNRKRLNKAFLFSASASNSNSNDENSEIQNKNEANNNNNKKSISNSSDSINNAISSTSSSLQQDKNKPKNNRTFLPPPKNRNQLSSTDYSSSQQQKNQIDREEDEKQKIPNEFCDEQHLEEEEIDDKHQNYDREEQRETQITPNYIQQNDLEEEKQILLNNEEEEEYVDTNAIQMKQNSKQQQNFQQYQEEDFEEQNNQLKQRNVKVQQYQEEEEDVKENIPQKQQKRNMRQQQKFQEYQEENSDEENIQQQEQNMKQQQKFQQYPEEEKDNENILQNQQKQNVKQQQKLQQYQEEDSEEENNQQNQRNVKQQQYQEEEEYIEENMQQQKQQQYQEENSDEENMQQNAKYQDKNYEENIKQQHQEDEEEEIEEKVQQKKEEQKPKQKSQDKQKPKPKQQQATRNPTAITTAAAKKKIIAASSKPTAKKPTTSIKNSSLHASSQRPQSTAAKTPRKPKTPQEFIYKSTQNKTTTTNKTTTKTTTTNKETTNSKTRSKSLPNSSLNLNTSTKTKTNANKTNNNNKTKQVSTQRRLSNQPQQNKSYLTSTSRRKSTPISSASTFNIKQTKQQQQQSSQVAGSRINTSKSTGAISKEKKQAKTPVLRITNKQTATTATKAPPTKSTTTATTPTPTPTPTATAAAPRTTMKTISTEKKTKELARIRRENENLRSQIVKLESEITDIDAELNRTPDVTITELQYEVERLTKMNNELQNRASFESATSVTTETIRAYEDYASSMKKWNQARSLINDEMRNLIEKGTTSQTVAFANPQLVDEIKNLEKEVKKARSEYEFNMKQRASILAPSSSPSPNTSPITHSKTQKKTNQGLQNINMSSDRIWSAYSLLMFENAFIQDELNFIESGIGEEKLLINKASIEPSIKKSNSDIQKKKSSIKQKQKVTQKQNYNNVEKPIDLIYKKKIKKLNQEIEDIEHAISTLNDDVELSYSEELSSMNLSSEEVPSQYDIFLKRNRNKKNESELLNSRKSLLISRDAFDKNEKKFARLKEIRYIYYDQNVQKTENDLALLEEEYSRLEAEINSGSNNTNNDGSTSDFVHIYEELDKINFDLLEARHEFKTSIDSFREAQENLADTESQLNEVDLSLNILKTELKQKQQKGIKIDFDSYNEGAQKLEDLFVARIGIASKLKLIEDSLDEKFRDVFDGQKINILKKIELLRQKIEEGNKPAEEEKSNKRQSTKSVESNKNPKKNEIINSISSSENEEENNFIINQNSKSTLKKKNYQNKNDQIDIESDEDEIPNNQHRNPNQNRNSIINNKKKNIIKIHSSESDDEDSYKFFPKNNTKPSNKNPVDDEDDNEPEQNKNKMSTNRKNRKSNENNFDIETYSQNKSDAEDGPVVPAKKQSKNKRRDDSSSDDDIPFYLNQNSHLIKNYDNEIAFDSNGEAIEDNQLNRDKNAKYESKRHRKPTQNFDVSD